jgi:hypothetical protein
MQLLPVLLLLLLLMLLLLPVLRLLRMRARCLNGTRRRPYPMQYALPAHMLLISAASHGCAVVVAADVADAAA